MKTSRIILALVIMQTLCLFIPQQICGQAETQDIIKYTPPKGWTKTLKDGAMVYVDMNKTSGAFCILTIFSSTPSLGSPQKDFAAQWDGLLVKPFKAAANPKTESQTNADGWQATVGAADVETDGLKAAAILTVFSGFGKTASILALVNDESYLAQVDSLVAGVKLNKTASTPPANSNVGVQRPGSDFLDFDPFPDKPRIQPQKPLIGRLRKTITTADLAGKWENGGASIMEYVNSSSSTSTSVSFGRTDFTIRGDGAYDSVSQSRASNTTIRESETGTIILTGGWFIMRSSKGREERYQFVSYMLQPNGAVVLSLIRRGDSPPLTPTELVANCGHANGYISCMGGEEWVRIP